MLQISVTVARGSRQLESWLQPAHFPPEGRDSSRSSGLEEAPARPTARSPTSPPRSRSNTAGAVGLVRSGLMETRLRSKRREPSHWLALWTLPFLGTPGPCVLRCSTPAFWMVTGSSLTYPATPISVISSPVTSSLAVTLLPQTTSTSLKKRNAAVKTQMKLVRTPTDSARSCSTPPP